MLPIENDPGRDLADQQDGGELAASRRAQGTGDDHPGRPGWLPRIRVSAPSGANSRCECSRAEWGDQPGDQRALARGVARFELGLGGERRLDLLFVVVRHGVSERGTPPRALGSVPRRVRRHLRLFAVAVDFLAWTLIQALGRFPPMCGICGATRDPDGRRVEAMAALMVHRGPDDHGFHLDPSGLALGARRLSIVDVAGGCNRSRTRTGRSWRCSTVRSTTTGGCASALLERGHSFATHCDTEVLVHLYEEYGDGLRARARRDVRVRDLGRAERAAAARPRPFRREAALLRRARHASSPFASELTALSAGQDGLDDLDPLAVDDFFVFGYVAGSRSILRGVHQLPPGHRLIWRRRPGRPRSTPTGDRRCRSRCRPSRLAELTAETGSILGASVALADGRRRAAGRASQRRHRLQR